jgi:hypothetical protein
MRKEWQNITAHHCPTFGNRVTISARGRANSRDQVRDGPDAW